MVNRSVPRTIINTGRRTIPAFNKVFEGLTRDTVNLIFITIAESLQNESGNLILTVIDPVIGDGTSSEFVIEER